MRLLFYLIFALTLLPVCILDWSSREAFLPPDTLMHYVLALVSAGFFSVLFLGLFPSRTIKVWKLLLVSVLVGTVGIFLLLAFQNRVGEANDYVGTDLKSTVVILICRAISFSYRIIDMPDVPVLLKLFGYTVGVGLCEELCKVFPMVLSESDDLNQTDIVLLALFGGMGFGVSEGIDYSVRYYNGVSGVDAYAIRFLSCVGLHSVWAGIAALKFYNSDSRRGLIGVLGYSIILHGTYDVFASQGSQWMASVVVIASFAMFSWLVWRNWDNPDDESPFKNLLEGMVELRTSIKYGYKILPRMPAIFRRAVTAARTPNRTFIHTGSPSNRASASEVRQKEEPRNLERLAGAEKPTNETKSVKHSAAAFQKVSPLSSEWFRDRPLRFWFLVWVVCSVALVIVGEGMLPGIPGMVLAVVCSAVMFLICMSLSLGQSLFSKLTEQFYEWRFQQTRKAGSAPDNNNGKSSSNFELTNNMVPSGPVPTFAPLAGESNRLVADKHFQRSNWAAARAFYDRCVDEGEHSEEVIERILQCILNESENARFNKKLVQKLHDRLVSKKSLVAAMLVQSLAQTRYPSINPFQKKSKAFRSFGLSN